VSSVVIVANADAELRQVVSSLLHDGYDAQGPMGPLDALRWCSAHRPAALLVDVELRDLSAAEFCGVVRGDRRARGFRFCFLAALRRRRWLRRLRVRTLMCQRRTY
jgi:CheY-like chemotaxis protein